MNTLRILLLITLVISAGCSGGGDDDSTVSDSDAPPICLALGQIGTKIINGTVCDFNASPVVQINIENTDGTQALCTGSIISPNKVLTAAHCFIITDVLSVAVDTGTQIIPAEKVVVHPGVGVDGVNLAVFNDVAIIITKRNMNITPLGIMVSQEVKKGEVIGVEGFGLDENDQFGTQKGGVMKVSKVTSNHIFAAYKGKNSNVCNGDSGGPAYVDIGTPENPVIGLVGVVSSGNPTTGCFEGDVSLFANLQNQEILDFILGVVPGAKLL